MVHGLVVLRSHLSRRVQLYDGRIGILAWDWNGFYNGGSAKGVRRILQQALSNAEGCRGKHPNGHLFLVGGSPTAGAASSVDCNGRRANQHVDVGGTVHWRSTALWTRATP